MPKDWFKNRGEKVEGFHPPESADEVAQRRAEKRQKYQPRHSRVDARGHATPGKTVEDAIDYYDKSKGKHKEK